MARFSNQRNLINEELLGKTRFVVVGAGAIGSLVTMGLSKMGGRDISVRDYDSLEDHNFSSQMYPISELGKLKVEALKSVALQYGDATIKTDSTPFNSETNSGECDIFVSAVDNMDVRAVLWQFYKSRCKLFIDGRMSGLVYKCYSIDTGDLEACKHYESTLHSQAEASPEPCGQKSIIYTVMLVSGQILSCIKQFLNNEDIPTEVVYDAYNNVMETKYFKRKELEVIHAE